jgi:hypothetical protein
MGETMHTDFYLKGLIESVHFEDKGDEKIGSEKWDWMRLAQDRNIGLYVTIVIVQISGSQGDEYEDYSLLGCCTV